MKLVNLVETGTQKRETKVKRDLKRTLLTFKKIFTDCITSRRDETKKKKKNQSERDFTRDLENPKKWAFSK